MVDVPRRRLFGRRSTTALSAPELVEAPLAAPDAKDLQPAEGAPVSRPAGPRGERTVTVAVRLTPAEHARWAAAGGRAQLGRWVRESVTGQLEGRPVGAVLSVEAAMEVAGVRAELSKVGSNLNQIARALKTVN